MEQTLIKTSLALGVSSYRGTGRVLTRDAEHKHPRMLPHYCHVEHSHRSVEGGQQCPRCGEPMLNPEA